jgi:hypothetical protein
MIYAVAVSLRLARRPARLVEPAAALRPGGGVEGVGLAHLVQLQSAEDLRPQGQAGAGATDRAKVM